MVGETGVGNKKKRSRVTHDLRRVWSCTFSEGDEDAVSAVTLAFVAPYAVVLSIEVELGEGC